MRLFGDPSVMNTSQEKYLNNLYSQFSAEQAYDFQREQQQTAATDLANQYESLGLSPSNIVSAGSNIAGAAPTASFSKQNIAAEALNREYGLAKGLISMAGSMAASGIYGSAINKVKSTAAKAAMQTAHSAETMDYKRLIYEMALKSSFDNQNKGL